MRDKEMSQDNAIFSGSVGKFFAASCFAECTLLRSINRPVAQAMAPFKAPATERDYATGPAPLLRGFVPRWHGLEVRMTDPIETLKREAAALTESGAAAREAGDETLAERHFRRALELALDAGRTIENPSHPGRLEILRMAVRLALDCGEVAEARRLMDEALAIDASCAFAEEWTQLRDVSEWPDAWLVAAVRRDPPDVAALNALAERYWRTLFGRCQLLTLNQDKASDLAQQAWVRVLRARHKLKPGGNFPGYLTTIATNVWRDAHRWARRAGPMADDRLASLDQAPTNDDGDNVVLADIVPDLNSLNVEDRTLLRLDIDRALEELTPQLREVLVARFINGESCAEIGVRYGRTEQSISGWVRQAIQVMRLHLQDRSQKAMPANQT